MSAPAPRIDFYTDMVQRLNQFSITPTRQRLQIAMTLFDNAAHLSAHEIYQLVNRDHNIACRATIYNTLKLFVNRGLIREVVVDSTRTFYDPNTKPHYHIFNADTGELLDIESESVDFNRLPPLPTGTREEGITLIIQVRNTRQPFKQEK